MYTWIIWGWVYSAIMALLTIVLVYRGGRSLNDHLVAVFVTACIGVYPVLWSGWVLEQPTRLGLVVIGLVLSLGPLIIYGLFRIRTTR